MPAQSASSLQGTLAGSISSPSTSGRVTEPAEPASDVEHPTRLAKPITQTRPGQQRRRGRKLTPGT